MDRTNPNILVIPNSELLNHGCRNCVWRLHSQCPHNIKENEVYTFFESPHEIKGYCPEFAKFLDSFAENEDSISAVWEKFATYVAKLQSMEDYRSYIELEKRIQKMELDSTANKDVILDLIDKKDRLKLWWAKLNEQVIRSLGKIVDREKKMMENAPRQLDNNEPKKINFDTGVKKDEKRN